MRREPLPAIGGTSQTWRARLEESAALLAPVVLIAGLALAGGGFEVFPRHVAGLAVWLVVVGLLVLGAGSRAALARPLLRSAGLILGLALVSALSSFWSGSVELSAIEADRVLVYLGFFLAAFLIAQTDERAQRFAEGLTIALAIVALMGLASRLLPDLVDVANGLGVGPQMRYPLGYWNANGVSAGIGAALLLWASRNAGFAWLRWAAAGLLPVALLALYFTFSRGGLLALAVAGACLIVLSHDRLWLLGTLAVGALGVVPAILATQARQALTDNIPGQETVDQGGEVLLFLLAGIALALLLFAGLRRLERRGGGLTGRALALSRNPATLRAIAIGAIALAIGAAVAIGGRAAEEFTESETQIADPTEQITDLSGAGRSDFWSVAGESFGERPALGIGAGTYEFAWERHREIERPVRDAHSLYLEAFAELGLVGGLLVLALVGTLLWTGFAAWRAAALDPRRDLYAALLAALLAFALAAAFDWFWEIAALGGVFFLAAGVLVAVRCRQLAPVAAAGGGDEQRGARLAIAGLVVAWISVVALIGPMLVERELDASSDALADGNIAAAVEHADTARSIEPWAASPYVQLGLLAEAQEDYATAARRYTQAIDREDGNWQLYYLRSRVESEAGNAAAARADVEEARRLNPLEQCLAEGPSCG
jgi:O-antigen ligase